MALHRTSSYSKETSPLETRGLDDEPPRYSASSNPQRSQSTSARKKIIVGLDYGTTNSGISFAVLEQGGLGDIDVVRQWPAGPTSCKAPSTIAYPEHNPDEDLEQVAWGFGTRGLEACLWTKLLLGGDTRKEGLGDTRLKKLLGKALLRLPEGKGAKDVVTDYLRELYKELEKNLTKRDERLFKMSPLEVWITVPAVWTDAARTATREAAIAAGFGSRPTERSRPADSVNIISEPEAAALTVMTREVGLGAIFDLDQGPRNVLICDCGGGTVDITTYKVSLDKDRKLQFEEILEGVGALCGSAFIDSNFDDWMIKEFGTSYTELEENERNLSSHFFAQFEDKKKSFTGPDHARRITVGPIHFQPAPKTPKYDKRNNNVILQASDMVELFEPQISEIIALVGKQVEAASRKDAKIDQLCLVGGFGDSQYLSSRMREWCSARNIQCGTPQACQEAIVKGAAIRGLLGLRPTRRVIRRHYGYSISMPYRDGLDEPYDLWISPWDGSKWCRYRMKWFATKGASLDDRATTTFNLQRTVFEDDMTLTGHLLVFDCDKTWAPETARSSHVNLLGDVRTYLPSLYIRDSETKMANGKRVYLVNYEMKVELNSLRGDIQFLPSINGNVLNSSTIEFKDTIATTKQSKSGRSSNSSSSSGRELSAEEMMRLFPDQLI